MHTTTTHPGSTAGTHGTRSGGLNAPILVRLQITLQRAATLRVLGGLDQFGFGGCCRPRPSSSRCCTASASLRCASNQTGLQALVAALSRSCCLCPQGTESGWGLIKLTVLVPIRSKSDPSADAPQSNAGRRHRVTSLPRCPRLSSSPRA